jgi:hypothetical protein
LIGWLLKQADVGFLKIFVRFRWWWRIGIYAVLIEDTRAEQEEGGG